MQNPALLKILKMMTPKILVEASADKLWANCIQLRDNDALKPEKWYNTGWMSTILCTIRDEPE